MAQHGGYRQPNNPAPVSGPGALSQRTDGHASIGDYTGGSYGSGQELHNLQAAAPMGSQASAAPPAPAAQAGLDTSGLTPLNAPTAQPGTPVTDGAALGPGAGPEALGLSPGDSVQSLRAQYGPIMPALVAQAQSRYATQAFKDSVRALLSIM